MRAIVYRTRRHQASSDGSDKMACPHGAPMPVECATCKVIMEQNIVAKAGMAENSLLAKMKETVSADAYKEYIRKRSAELQGTRRNKDRETPKA